MGPCVRRDDTVCVANLTGKIQNRNCIDTTYHLNIITPPVDRAARARHGGVVVLPPNSIS
jgi:hypothetical protein